MDWEHAQNRIRQTNPLRVTGRVMKVVGLTVESMGPPASVGDILYVDHPRAPTTPLQVIGFSGRMLRAMPLGELSGLQPGMRLYSNRQPLSIPVDDQSLGRVLNALGQPIDGGPPLNASRFMTVNQPPRSAMKRAAIQNPLGTGVRVIDGLISLGKGQRMGIFAGSGVGKSSLLGMMARGCSADINVIALVGERGRELREFIEQSLGPEGMKRSVVVVATSDEAPPLKITAAFTATAIAEHHARQGRDVLLMMDSLTRLAMAQREIGLSAGEPPSTKGYTPSVFTLMPRLLERAGAFEEQGSITAIYTVLVEGDDVNEPISDHARSILDGHIVLSRDLAHRNHYPAVDVLGSVSRLMNQITSPEHRQKAGEIRALLATYRDAEDMINIGAYQKGTNPRIDRAVARIDGIRSFLLQKEEDKVSWDQVTEALRSLPL